MKTVGKWKEKRACLMLNSNQTKLMQRSKSYSKCFFNFLFTWFCFFNFFSLGKPFFIFILQHKSLLKIATKLISLSNIHWDYHCKNFADLQAIYWRTFLKCMTQLIVNCNSDVTKYVVFVIHDNSREPQRWRINFTIMRFSISTWNLNSLILK